MVILFLHWSIPNHCPNGNLGPLESLPLSLELVIDDGCYLPSLASTQSLVESCLPFLGLVIDDGCSLPSLVNTQALF